MTPVTIVPRWEWRVFGDRFGVAEASFGALEPERVQESDEVYLLSRRTDASVKVRDELMDVKELRAVNDNGLEQWEPVLKRAFPLAAGDVGSVFGALGLPAPETKRNAYTLDELIDELVEPCGDLKAVHVHKHREHFTVAGCMAELSEITIEGGATRTIAVESEDSARLIDTVRRFGLESGPNVCLARGLKALAGFGALRFAVIDVGTNSVKFHVGERQADGSWHTIADRAEITRLGEGLDEDGRLHEAPIERTAAAIAAMADEARQDGAEEIAAVGTAGLRIATNSAELLDTVRDLCGVEIEVISAEEEARLAALAAISALGIARGSFVVFDTGGGSSQFTFGHGTSVDERFSVDVGSVRFTERFGLEGVVSADALHRACEAISAELGGLDDRQVPDALVGMGGAVTNLAAVKHGLATYDPDIVQGTVLDRGELDRQIELYRTQTVDERRSVVGLQPKRADVILAGACIVRTVLEKLDSESLTVSDRALRHGLLVVRFGSGANTNARPKGAR
jgi:exopolyphosphatase / guanosine-5'-triphosphate,3'-diphosphate pyrophosphatase